MRRRIEQEEKCFVEFCHRGSGSDHPENNWVARRSRLLQSFCIVCCDLRDLRSGRLREDELTEYDLVGAEQFG